MSQPILPDSTRHPRRPLRRARIPLLLLLFFLLLLSQLHAFLSLTRPPHHGYMTLESWLDDRALQHAVDLYQAGNYHGILCTGGPIETGHYLAPHKTYPAMTAARLQHLGIPSEQIQIITAPLVQRDRTYASALALRQHLDQHPLPPNTPLHLISVGTHARRSHLLFKRALGNQIEIGITALPDPTYPPHRWYAHSRGVRALISETIAYSYAKLHPNP
ncbi:MAG: YdcF family protein [Kiritimatiellaceae bacterium]|nr:MAG: YdcF family protein [Kiritimatiellaceae bacterium]|tara:strand:+ start:1232 stop:1885 length:654 start_codon:yes stop_codon:yes gene_type:complete